MCALGGIPPANVGAFLTVRWSLNSGTLKPLAMSHGGALLAVRGTRGTMGLRMCKSYKPSSRGCGSTSARAALGPAWEGEWVPGGRWTSRHPDLSRHSWNRGALRNRGRPRQAPSGPGDDAPPDRRSEGGMSSRLPPGLRFPGADPSCGPSVCRGELVSVDPLLIGLRLGELPIAKRNCQHVHCSSREIR